MTLRASRRAALASLTLVLAAPATHGEPPATVFVTATCATQPLADIISNSVTIGAAQIAGSGAGSVIDLLQRQRRCEGVDRNSLRLSISSDATLLRGALERLRQPE